MLKCEIFVTKILPNIRKELAYILYTKYHLSQKEIAEKLSITQSSISQYFSGKRCKYNYNFDKEEIEILEKISKELVNDNKNLKDISEYLCKLCDIYFKKQMIKKS